ncbi:MAG TPA: hypothetical protein VJZ27_08640 [Aggregatilineales bacterium]|nr:hypothetical protein [Aggregatilineales bacterium]
MSKRETRFTFTRCLICQMLARERGDSFVCMAWEFPELDEDALEKLMHQTPFARWEPPAEIGDTYNYSPKHVIRLVSESKNQIAAFNIQGRWFILTCSFAHYLTTSGKINLHYPENDDEVSN